MSRTTLAAPCRHLLEVKKSRFVAHAAPLPEVDAAIGRLQQLADPTASHNCWAYRIGQCYRFNDDGEPSGTAGRPILAAIDGSGLDGVVVVVSRWFGGIKLGAGGLVRAYGGAAAECLRLAERVTWVARQAVELRCAFELLGAVHALLKTYAADKQAEAFDADGVVLQLQLAADRVDALDDALRDLSRGQAQLRRR